MSRSVVILGGGLASRLGGITKEIPKSMILIHDRPFIDFQFELLKTQNLRDIIYCTGFLGEQVEKHVGDGSKFGLNVKFSRDGAFPLGTGGAVRRALPLASDPFFLMYGDSYLPTQFAPVMSYFLKERETRTPRPLALMTVFKNENLFDRSNVLFRDGQLLRYDKKSPDNSMKYIDWGLGIFSHSAFDSKPKDIPFDLADTYSSLSQNNQLLGFEVKKRFFEIGSLSGLSTFRDEFPVTKIRLTGGEIDK